jgi:uncharacterized membrane protein
MGAYAAVKTLHILSSVLLVGTGFGSAFYLYFANRSGRVEAIAVVSRLVVRADFWFTTPAILVQPLTGLWLAREAAWGLESPWLLLAASLYLLAGACWLPVVWLQIRMAKLARRAHAEREALPAAYWRHAKAWERLGVPAFIAMVAIYALMVSKPGFG